MVFGIALLQLHHCSDQGLGISMEFLWSCTMVYLVTGSEAGIGPLCCRSWRVRLQSFHHRSSAPLTPESETLEHSIVSRTFCTWTTQSSLHFLQAFNKQLVPAHSKWVWRNEIKLFRNSKDILSYSIKKTDQK